MSVLDQIAHFQGRRDEVPNQELARQLAGARDAEGVREIAKNLWHRDRRVQADCIKVLYEVGYLAPELVAPYASEFLKLLRSRNNRLVWGGMIALATIAGLATDTLYPQRAEILKAMEHGSVITVDAGVQALAGLAATRAERRRELLPILFEHLRTCRPKDVAQHCEKIAPAVDAEHADAFIQVLETRMEDLSKAQVSRVNRVVRQVKERVGKG